jgi:hypothetical protein
MAITKDSVRIKAYADMWNGDEIQDETFWIRMRQDIKIWTRKDGSKVLIVKLSDRHLQACIALMQKAEQQHLPAYAALKFEHAMRAVEPKGDQDGATTGVGDD